MENTIDEKEFYKGKAVISFEGVGGDGLSEGGVKVTCTLYDGDGKELEDEGRIGIAHMMCARVLTLIESMYDQDQLPDHLAETIKDIIH